LAFVFNFGYVRAGKENRVRHALAIWSLVLVCVSAWFFFVGFSIDTTVPTDTPLAGGMQGISNLQLMHIQLLDIVIGCVSGLGACVMFAGAMIVSAVQGPAE
jgi:hypothetical protein